LFCVGLLFLIIWKNKINFFTILNKTKIANKDV